MNTARLGVGRSERHVILSVFKRVSKGVDQTGDARSMLLLSRPLPLCVQAVASVFNLAAGRDGRLVDPMETL
jgi:hypothetical protein